MWSYREKRFVETGLQFCGTVMGDHSKTAINTQLNTGTVVGVAANILKPDFRQILYTHLPGEERMMIRSSAWIKPMKLLKL